MATKVVDAFLAYHEGEGKVAEINNWLIGKGVVTYFFPRDLQPGEPIDERDTLLNAATVVVFLGDAGWGPIQEVLVREAAERDIPLIPVRIGSPSQGDMSRLNGLFSDRFYIDLREFGEERLLRLLKAIRDSSRMRDNTIAHIIRRLIDGNEEERQAALNEVKRGSRDTAALAARLRADISGRFSPESGQEAYHGGRNANLTTSIRSWMLSTLIWCDPENQETRTLVLKHVSMSSEPDSNVRYWALAGAYARATSYCDEAAHAAVQDMDTVVAHLAMAILAPEPSAIAPQFKELLRSEQVQPVLQTLRILRVVPVPGLALDVCSLLFKTLEDVPLAYDVFYALSHPLMAAAAAPLLVKDPGLDATVDRLLFAADEANQTAADHFVTVLEAMDRPEVVAALRTRTTDARYGRVASRLLRILVRLQGDGSGGHVWMPGFAPDSVDDQIDHLAIGPEVRTLTAIMLARNVTPPLAIGLFGDWGSGKSFFMRAMRQSARQISERAAKTENSTFCSHVVQIEFNAWHYADTNLWASLVTFILERLAEYVAPTASPEERQAALIAELDSAQAAKRATLAERERAAEQVKQDEARLQAFRQQRQNKEVQLSDLRLTDLHTLLKSDVDAKKTIEQALEGLGLPNTLSSLTDLRRTMSEAYSVGGRMASLLNALTTSGRGFAFTVLLVFVLFVVPLCAYLIQRHYTELHGIVIASAAVIAQVGAVAAATSRWIRRALKTVGDNLKEVESAKQKVDELLAKKRKEPTQNELDLSLQIEELKIKEQEAAARLAEASTRVSVLEEHLRQLQEGSSLAHFLWSRTGSDDYRKHLGLVSMVRKDFDALSQRLRKGGALGKSFNPVERIVLYIDDLDRCPAAKVVEVLQAVHLLLAYPLFAVVVGVDSRWLLRSLASHYRQLEGASDAAGVSVDEWTATPQHYLEKIFQIPFSLRPMTAQGYSRLIGQLMSNGPSDENTEPPETANKVRGVPSESNVSLSASASASSSASAAPGGQTVKKTPVAQSGNAASASSAASHADPEFEVREEALVIRTWESLFAESLGGLIPSPRAAKRLSNVYRILKARVTIEHLEAFEGSSDAPGEFQVPMLLLAMLIFDSRLAVAWFGSLSRNALRHESAAAALISELDATGDDPVAQMVVAMVRDIATSPSFPRDPRLLIDWIPQVARFSFDLARLVASDAHRRARDPGAS